MFSVQKDRYFPLTVCLPRIAKKQVYFCIDEQFYNGIPDTTGIRDLREWFAFQNG